MSKPNIILEIEKSIGFPLPEIALDENGNFQDWNMGKYIRYIAGTRGYVVDQNNQIVALALDYIHEGQIPWAIILHELSQLQKLSLRGGMSKWPDVSHKLNHLRELRIGYNPKLKDYNFLYNLPSLISLSLRNNNLSQVEFLYQLPSLEVLDLRNNNLSQENFLSRLVNLTSLDLRNNNLNRVASLSQLTSLVSLDLSDNKEIENYNFLGQLTQLTSLYLSSNRQINDYDFLNELPCLNTLSLRNNNLSRVDFLSQLASLTSLDLSENNLGRADALSQLTGLTSLDLRNNSLKSGSFVRKLASLKLLSLSSNHLDSLDSLRDLDSLISLDLSENHLEQVSFLSQLTSLTSLDLRNNNLSHVNLLGRLTNLNLLDLSWNSQIRDYSFLGRLTNLTSLSLRNNDLEHVRFLGQLPNITSLDLSWNKQIKDYDFLDQLPHLTSLSLRNNDLRNVSFLGRVTTLTSLSLRNNDLTSIDFLDQLPSLTSLSLRNNHLHHIDFRGQSISLISLDLRNNHFEQVNFLRGFKSLTSLYLDGNNLHTPPPEIISKGLEAIKSYFAEQEKGKPQPLYEARVLFVGQPGAGKTTLMRKLIDPTYQVPQEQESTVGIHIHKGWEFDCIPSPSGKFQANLWDFGGQEIQYQIHHFFLSSRVLYVLLADNRRQDTEFDYWFDIIQRLGLDQNKKASPVLVVLNENQHKSVTNYDEEHYNRLYPDLPKVKGEVDLSEPHDPKRKIWNGRYLDVRQKICSMLQGLDHVGDLLPQSWVEVRQDIEKLADTYKHIGLTKYQEVCVSKGIENERDQLVLSQYLHDLGLMLHFQHDEALVEFIILQPQWAVNAIYDILSDQEIEKSEGQFTQEWLYSRWGKQYTNREKGKLLTMMKKDQFDLIHQVKNVKDTYMVPSLMSDKDPQNDWNYRGNLRYRYQYGFMPKGLVPRLAVRLGDFTQYIAGKPQTWKKGVILEYEGAIAKIELSYYDDAKGIGISIQGGATERKILLERIRMEMPKLHEKFKDFPPKELIPCHCPVCEGAIEPNYYKVEELKGYLEGGEQEVYCIKGKQRVNILGLIGGVMDYSYSSEQTHPTMEFGVKNSDSSPNIREDKLIELLKLAIVNSNNPNALQVNVNQQVAQTNKVNIHLEIRQDWVDLQSHFEDFKDWMLEEVAPEDEAKLEKIQDKLDQTQGNEEAIQKSGLMPKVKRYLEKKLGATSALGDKLSKIQKGREAIEKLADSFNKLAKNLGLDQLDPTDLIP